LLPGNWLSNFIIAIIMAHDTRALQATGRARHAQMNTARPTAVRRTTTAARRSDRSLHHTHGFTLHDLAVLGVGVGARDLLSLCCALAVSN
jgi:hypothetical protein